MPHERQFPRAITSPSPPARPWGVGQPAALQGAALVLVALLGACGGSAGTGGDEPDRVYETGADAADLTGRWTSAGFEQAFEARLMNTGGAITGQVCGPADAERTCGPVAAGWVDGIIHFDFVLPRNDAAGGSVRYEFVGSGDPATGVLTGSLHLPGGGQALVAWTFCPDVSLWCETDAANPAVAGPGEPPGA